MHLGDTQIRQPHRRDRLSLWEDVQRLLVNFQSMMKLPLLLQLVAQVLQAEQADMRTLGLTDGLFQSLTRGGAIIEAKSNPKAHRHHTTHEDAVYRQILKFEARKLNSLCAIQLLR